MPTENKKTVESPRVQAGKYFEAVGRRKTSVARVRLYLEKNKNVSMSVNEKPYNVYFFTTALRKISEEALKKISLEGDFRVSAKVSGGGIHSQAEALRHGISRALLKVDEGHRKSLKVMGFLKRDPRMKERRKFGLKKARKAPQWA